MDALEQQVAPFSWCPRARELPAALRAARALLLLPQALAGSALALAYAALLYGAYAAVALPLAALGCALFTLAERCCCCCGSGSGSGSGLRGEARGRRARACCGAAALHLAQACFLLLAVPFAALLAALNVDTLLCLAAHSLLQRWRTGSFRADHLTLSPLGGVTLFFFVLGSIALGADQPPHQLVQW